MFDPDQLTADCRTALQADRSPHFVREVVARAVSEPTQVLRSLGEPQRGGIQTLHRSAELTVLNIVWAPYMTLMPHNHRMWAVIGIYTGREDNLFWRRLPDSSAGRIEAVGAKALGARDAEPLGVNIIHSVTNPIPRLTAAIHVYGGDFFAEGRSQWDPETLEEERWDPDRLMRRFEEANQTAVLSQLGA